MDKGQQSPIILFILVVVFLAVIFLMRNVSPLEKDCTDSGGSIVTNNCCKSAGDFPNSCLIGACGCSPENSHSVKFCECPEGKCWDGHSCVSNTPSGETTTTTMLTTTTIPSTTTSMTIPVSNCTGTNARICSLGSKSDCTMYKCCYWDLNISKCKPKSCSDLDADFCESCGCTFSQ